MPNQTWLEAVNEGLKYARISTIPSAAIFNDDSKLEDPQQAMKYFYRLFHRKLSLRATSHYAKRRIQLLIDENNHTYTLDTGVNPESIEFRTFRNITTSSSTYGNLEVWDHNKFRDCYQDPSQITSGRPVAVVILPIERTDFSPIRKVRIVPNPDRSYELEYVAKLNGYELENADSIVLFPREYSHVVELFSWAQLETALGEGKEGLIWELAEQAAKEVKLAAGTPDDIRKSVRTIRMSRKRGYWYR